MKKTIIKSSKQVSDERKRKKEEETCPECKSNISGERSEAMLKGKLLKVIPIYESVKVYTCYSCGCRWRVE